jgi:O-antigen ligase
MDISNRFVRACAFSACRGKGLFILLTGLLLGLVAALVGPPLMVIVGTGLAVATILLVTVLKGYRVFWVYLVFLLLGYQFLGKGFAYVGYYPIYVGEIGLALAGVSVLLTLLLNRLKKKTISRRLRLEVLLLLVFIAWQAFRTIPYLTEYSYDAARDAMLWGYAAYALIICLLIPRDTVSRLFRLYGRVLPFFLAWLPVAYVLMRIAPINIRFPGSPISLIHLKSGDVGVHLGGAAAFMLLRFDLRDKPWSQAKLWFLWFLWLVAWLAYGATNRAGMLSALTGVAVVLLQRPQTRWYRPLVLSIVMLGLLFATNFSLNVGQHDISFQQLVDNVASTFSRGPIALEETKQWRLQWWKTIWDYTFNGQYFWVGKGYGINLADSDGFQVAWDHSLRSPHNAFMTILARSGVPGLILWLLFLLAFGWMLAKRSLAAKRSPDVWNARYALWLLAYWMAFLFNASFDVFLEGPMGGVWFWSLVGAGLVYFTKENRLPHGNCKTEPGIASEPGCAR